MRIDLDLEPFLPQQFEGFIFDPPPGEVAVTAFLGGWGSGKTHGAARKFLRRCLENPYTPKYKDGHPKSIIVAPTNKVLQQATLAQFYSVCPRQLIIKDRGQPHSDILLINGHKILKHSGEGMIEGMDACVCWIDEISKDVFSSNPAKYLNYLARLRDPHAPIKEMIVSGLPDNGWVRDTFDVKASNRLTLLMPTASNTYIDSALMNVFYQNCPSGEERQLLGGQWLPVEGSIYRMFDASRHIVDTPPTTAQCHIGLDVGDHGAIIIAQKIKVDVRNVTGQVSKADGLLIVDEIITRGDSVDAMCYKLRMSKWNVGSESTMSIDPMSRRDELVAIKRHFPNTRVISRTRAHELFPVEAGVRVVQRALKDALGNTRLLFHRSIVNNQNGLVDSIPRYKRNESTGKPVKDQRTDHPLDALRYLVCECLRPERPETRIL